MTDQSNHEQTGQEQPFSETLTGYYDRAFKRLLKNVGAPLPPMSVKDLVTLAKSEEWARCLACVGEDVPETYELVKAYRKGYETNQAKQEIRDRINQKAI